MKVGDKVYCKKDLNDWFHKQNYYNIMYLYCETNIKRIIIRDEYGEGVEFLKNWREFRDYFYTKKILRKMRLKKLEKINERSYM